MSSYSFMRWPQGNCAPSSNHVHIFDREKVPDSVIYIWFDDTKKSFGMAETEDEKLSSELLVKDEKFVSNSSLLSFEHLETMMSHLIKYSFET